MRILGFLHTFFVLTLFCSATPSVFAESRGEQLAQARLIREFTAQVELMRERSEQDRQLAKIYYGDITLMEKAAAALERGQNEDFERAETLQKRYLHIIESNGVVRRLKQNQVSLRTSRGSRWALGRYLARVEPEAISRQSSLMVGELAFEMARRVQRTDRLGQESEQLRIALISFSKTLRKNPLMAADYLLYRRLFEFQVGHATRAFAEGYENEALDLASKISTMMTYFAASPRRDTRDSILGTVQHHRFPRGLVALTANRVNSLIDAETAREIRSIWTEAMWNAADRVSLVLSVTGLGLMWKAGFTAGRLFMAGLKVYQASNLIGGVVQFRGALSAARSGDERTMGIAFANTVMLAALGLGKPLATTIGFVRTRGGKAVQTAMSESLKQSASGGSRLASGLLSLESSGTIAYRSFVVFTQLNLARVNFDRFARADEIARIEGRSAAQIRAEETGLILLRAMNLSARGADWLR